MVTEFSNPCGLPKAKTTCPCLRRSESASSNAGRSLASIFSTARSDWRSSPITLAVTGPCGCEPSSPAGDSSPGSRTRILRAPCTTCALVTMYPSADRITPAPMASCGSNSAVSLAGLSDFNPYPVATICTTDLVTLAVSSWMESLKMCSGSRRATLGAVVVGCALLSDCA